MSAMQFFSSLSTFHRGGFTPPLFTIVSLRGTVRLLLRDLGIGPSLSHNSANSKQIRRGFSACLHSGFFNSGHNFNINASNKNYMCNMNNTMHGSSVLRLDDYDCVGFDLDNTLCEYNISPSVEMEYNVLANFLVKEKGYDPNCLLKPLDVKSTDFLQKGLLVDFARGNLLKIVDNGVISRASHGTKFMSKKEIIDAYGEDRKWEVTSELNKNLLVGWNGPLSERVRALLDYFDMPASLAFARIVDSLDEKLGKPADVYNVWPDVLAGLQNMYKREHFMSGEGGYFKEIKSNPHKYIKECNHDVVEWLKEIKKSKLTFLITGSNCDFASLTAETGLGKNWRSLFDVIVCYARKPGFFTGCRPFIELDGFKETDPVNGTITLGKMYSQGNWQELYQLFAKTLGKQEPKCLYFGDNLVQDVYTPSEYTKCETVAVVEELSVECNRGQIGGEEVHTSLPVLSSNSWGSYFHDSQEGNLSTLWGSVINNYSSICVPTLSVLAQYPISHEFNTFYRRHEGGYFPSSPDSLTKKKVDAI